MVLPMFDEGNCWVVESILMDAAVLACERLIAVALAKATAMRKIANTNVLFI